MKLKYMKLAEISMCWAIDSSYSFLVIFYLSKVFTMSAVQYKNWMKKWSDGHMRFGTIIVQMEGTATLWFW